MKIWTLILILVFALGLSGCIPSPSNTGDINLGDNANTGVAESKRVPVDRTLHVNNVLIENNQLKIIGKNLDTINTVQLTGTGVDEYFDIETKTSAQIIANGRRNFSFLVEKMFSLVLSNALGSSVFTINFEIPLGSISADKLGQMGALDGQVMKWNQTMLRWEPAHFNGLTFGGTWDASLNIPDLSLLTPLNGTYYVISTPGASLLNGISTWVSGDWVIYRTGTGWERVINSGAVTSVFGQTGAISFGVNTLTDVDTVTSAPTSNQGLMWDGSKWVPGTFILGTGNTVLTSDLADGSVTGVKLPANVITSDKILDESILSADIKNGSIVAADLAGGFSLDATQVGPGSIDNSEFAMLDNTSSNIQAQLDDMMKTDGSRAMTANLNLAGFDITNLGSFGLTGDLALTTTDNDLAGTNIPISITDDTSALAFGTTTEGRMLRLNRTGQSFYDIGMDSDHEFTIYNRGATTIALKIDSTGRLGVGVKDPSEMVEVGHATDSKTAVLVQNTAINGDPMYALSIPGNRNWQMGIDDSTGDSLNFETNTTGIAAFNPNNIVMTLDASKNVGIGNPAPTTKLHVGKATLSSDVVITAESKRDSALHLFADADTPSLGSDNNPYVLMRQDGVSNDAVMGIVGNAGEEPSAGSGGAFTDSLQDALLIAAGIANLPSTQNLQFGTNGAVRMTIDENGNVGIGTKTPTSPLTVAGTVEFDALTIDNITIDGNSVSSTTGVLQLAPADNVEIQADKDAADDTFLNQFHMVLTEDSTTSNDEVGLGFRIDTTLDNTVTPQGAITVERLATADEGDMHFKTANGVAGQLNTVMTITSDGKVGIGTNTPDATSSLTVVGSIVSTDFKTTSGQADFDNIRIDGNTVSSTGGSNDIVLDPNATGRVVVDGSRTIATTGGNDLNIQADAANSGSSLNVIARGAAPGAASDFNIYSTDFALDAVNYEKISFTKNVGGSAVIKSEAGGTGTVRDLQLTTGANNGVIVDSAGLVGVGIATPLSDLHVSSAGADATIMVGESDTKRGNLHLLGHATGSTDGGELRLYIPFDHDLANGTATDEYWFIDSFEDDLRIGSSSGGADLVIDPTGNLTISADDAVATDYGTDGQLHINGATNANKRLSIGFNTTTDRGFIQAAIDLTSVQPLLLNPDDGNVGIGITTAPGAALEVDGNIIADDPTAGNHVVTRDYALTKITIIQDDDLDTKIQTDEGAGDDDTIRFDTLAVERMVIGPTGNVGIGTATPATLLEVSSTSDIGDAALTIEADADNNLANDNPYIHFKQDGGTIEGLLGLIGNAAAGPDETATTETLADALYLGTKDTTAVQFGNNNAVNMTILSGGNVGVGTNAPSAKLQAHESSAGAVEIKLSNTDTGVTATDGSAIGLAADESLILWNYENTYIGIGTNNVERMRVLAGGNVGIGTAAPATLLEVSSPSDIGDSVVTIEADADDDTENDNPYIHFKQDAGAVEGFIGLVGNAGAGPDETATTEALADALFIGKKASSPIQFGTNNISRMTILGGGNVGIGTNAPSSLLDMVIDDASNTSVVNALELTHSTSGAAANGIGTGILFKSEDDSGGIEDIAAIQALHTDVTNAAELSELQFQTASAGTLSTKMTLKADGKVGIGTTSPNNLFHILGAGAIVDIENNANTDSGIRLLNTNTPGDPDPSYIMYGYQGGGGMEESWKAGVTENNADDYHWKTATSHAFDGTGTIRMTLTNGGNLGIGTSSPSDTLTVNGSAAKPGGGSFIAISDIRLKDVKGDYEYGLKEIMKLNPIRFSYKKENPVGYKADKNYVGFIAQEVQDIIPEAVSLMSNGYLNLDFQPLNMAMFNAIKEQQAEIEKNRDMFQAMQGKWEDIERRIASLEEENVQLKEENESLKLRLQKIEKILNINP